MEPLVISAAVMLLGWLVSRRRDKTTHQPRRWAVRAGTWLTLGATLAGVVAWPEPTGDRLTDALALLAWLTLGWCTTYSASHRATGWTSVGEVVTTAVTLGWRTPLRALAGVTALTLAGWVYVSLPVEHVAVLAVAVALTPAVAVGVSALDREHTTTMIEHSMAGMLTGGQEWEKAQAILRGATVRVRFGSGGPKAVRAKLPPDWPLRRTDDLKAEARGRLETWGCPWFVSVDPSARTLVATRNDPLPEMIRVPEDRSWEWIEEAKPGPMALYLGDALNDATGEREPVWWDPDASDPHSLVGGRTKSGKTVLLCLMILQAVMRGWKVIIADPKGRDFRWAGGLPGVLLWTTDESPLALREAAQEMDDRAAWGGRRVWQGEGHEAVDLLSMDGHDYRPCLVIVDEGAELSILGGEQTEEDLGRLMRLARAQGMVCVTAIQRPDSDYLTGEIKGNIGCRVQVMSDGDTQMTKMILDRAVSELPALTAQVRGRARVLIGGGEPRETQLGFLDLKAALDAIPRTETPATPRFEKAPAWHAWTAGAADAPGDATTPPDDQPGDHDPLSDEDLAALLDDGGDNE